MVSVKKLLKSNPYNIISNEKKKTRCYQKVSRQVVFGADWKVGTDCKTLTRVGRSFSRI